jgi:serine protease Do/serine protease DegQ
MLGDDTPRFAAAQSVETAVSVVATSTATTALAPREVGTDVRVEATTSDGTRTSNAVVIDRTTLVTTMAAVAGASKLTALLPDGRRLRAKLLGKDARSSIAVLDISGGELVAATTGTAVPLHSGEKLWMSGQGAPGTITGLGRNTTSPDGSKLRHVIRLDLDQRKAREGMALLDDEGTVVALCTRDAKGDVIGIPIDLATSAAHSLRTHRGKLVLPWIGVTGRDVEPDSASGLPHGGALLTAVDVGGPAESAGLEPGDVVVALHGTSVSSISALVLAARSFQSGDTVTVSLLRDDQLLRLPLVLGRLP